MTMQETLDFLDIVKAYYPASYRNYSTQEAKAVVVVWQEAFSGVPIDVMIMALKRYKDKEKFAPTVAEINKILSAIHEDMRVFLSYPPFLKRLPSQELDRRRRIYELTKPYAEAYSGTEAYISGALLSGGYAQLDDGRKG